MFGYAVTMLSLGAGLLVTFLGVPLLAAGLAGCRGLGAWSGPGRAALLGWTWPSRSRCALADGGVMAWVGAVLKSGVSWRHLLYALLHFPWAVFSFVVVGRLLDVRLGAADCIRCGSGSSRRTRAAGGIQLYGDGTARLLSGHPLRDGRDQRWSAWSSSWSRRG